MNRYEFISNGLKPHCSKEYTSSTTTEQGPLVPCISVPCISSLPSSVYCNTDDEKPFHITWVTHNSRTSQRMIEFKVKKGEPVILNECQEIEISKYISDIVKEKKLRVISFNICRDHVHILLYCKESELSNIICALKSKSTYLYKKNNKITDSISIWGQKYNCSYIETEDKFYSCIEYIKNNRKKHSLPENDLLNRIIHEMINLSTLEQGASVPCFTLDNEIRIVEGENK